MYADLDYYLNDYLLGGKPKMPPDRFLFWEKRARAWIDKLTFNRINESAIDRYGEAIRQCACELAEWLYVNEDSEGKVQESITGRSATYVVGTPYHICQRHLQMTGLLYRGANDTTGLGEE